MGDQIYTAVVKAGFGLSGRIAGTASSTMRPIATDVAT